MQDSHDMDIHQLQALVAVDKAGTFTQAAVRLHLSQSSLSRRIARLEADLGHVLIDRAGQHVRFTPAGRKVLLFARETLSARERLLAELRADRDVRGTVRVLASTTPGEHIVPELVAQVRGLHPAVAVEVRQGDSEEVVAGVLGGVADVGFVGNPVDDARLATMPVAADEIVLAVSPSHRFARRTQIDVAELVGERLIFRERGSGTYRTVVQALRARGMGLPQEEPAMVLGSTQAVSAAAAAGLGIGFVSTRALRAHAPDRLVSIRLEGIALDRQLLAIHLRQREQPPAVTAFLRFLERRDDRVGAAATGALRDAAG